MNTRFVGSLPFTFRSFVHAPNVVTFGYTSQWWEWQRWEQFVDWLALHGVNLPLLPLAHEAVLIRVSTRTKCFVTFCSIQRIGV